MKQVTFSIDFYTKLIGTILCGDFGTKPNNKIASFDLENTLIRTKSGCTFPKNVSDWTWWHETVPKMLKQAHQDNLKIVIFTNQAGVKVGQITISDLRNKFVQIYNSLKIPFQFFCATKTDENRKPGNGMWEHFINNQNGNKVIDLEASFF